MRVLVSGSRGWRDQEFVWTRLAEVLSRVPPDQILTVVHGGARGADTMAKHWVEMAQRVGHDVEDEVHPYLGQYGRAGGHVRNQEMVNAGADIVLAFILDNSPGATSLVDKARKAGLLVEEFHETTEVDVTEETTPTLTPEERLVERLVAVKADIGAVGKEGFNAAQKFNFRGIDAVLNAVAPALVKHGVVVYPTVRNVERGTAATSAGKSMNTYLVTVDYTFTDGAASLITTVIGESFDSGDKGATKAMSVAYRTALIQALSLPTDEPDPDLDVYDAQPKVEQMSDAELLLEIERRTDVNKVKELWAEQDMNNRSSELQKAIKDRVAALQA